MDSVTAIIVGKRHSQLLKFFFDLTMLIKYALKIAM